jgi:hypothetical protein
MHGTYNKIIYFYVPYALSSLRRYLVTQRALEFRKEEKEALHLAILEADKYIIYI